MENVIFCPSLPEAFNHAGMPYPEREPEPGKLSRFPTNDRDRNDRAGWCKLFPDQDGAAFGDWRTGDAFTWQRRDMSAPPPSPQERAQARQRAEQARQQAEQERQDGYAKTAGECSAQWGELDPAPADHDYLRRKGIRAHLARLDAAGRLVLPVFDASGEIQSLQAIAPDGAKRFHLGGKMQGGRLFIGTPADGSPLVLAEGFATAASIREAAGLVVVVGFAGNNLRHVAESLRRQFPRSPILIAGDLDAHGAGRKYAEAAQDAAQPARLAFPIFKDGRPAGDYNDLAQAESPEAVKRQILEALAPASRFRLMDAEQFAEQPPLEWAVKGLIPRRGVVAAYGPSGCGKSFLVLDLLGAVTEGREWFGLRTVRTPALYICLEGAAGFGKRLAAYRAEVGSLAGFKILAEQFRLTDRTDEVDIIAAIRAHGLAGGVVCIDTLAQATPGMDENSGEDMTQAIAACQRIQQATETLLLLVHHTGKDAGKGLRGHSSLIGALDASIEVSGGLDGIPRQWEARKVKDDTTGEAHPFNLRRVVLGLDADGDDISSCVVEPVESAGDAVRRVKLPQGGNQKVIWDGIGDLLKQSADFGKAEAPPSRPCIQLERAIEQLRGRLTCPTDKQTGRTRDAFTGLINKGLLVHRAGWIWLS